MDREITCYKRVSVIIFVVIGLSYDIDMIFLSLPLTPSFSLNLEVDGITLQLSIIDFIH